MDVFQRGVIASHPCPAPKLMHSIEDFFNFYSTGILVTSRFVVAIWKESGEFFIFYSFPIDEVGRIKRVKLDQPPAFPGLVVFKSVDELYENIIGNIDRESYCKPFELRVCTITMTDLLEAPFESTSCGEIRKFINEELIPPAISADAAEELVEIRTKSDSTKTTKLNPDVMKQILKRKCGTPGFISFSKGGLVCGTLSKCSKKWRKFTRKRQVGFSNFPLLIANINSCLSLQQFAW
jgi:hypothetical protein